MKRRKFLLTSGSTILTGTAFGSLQQPGIGLEFELSAVPYKQISDINSVLVKLTKFEITPLYIDETTGLSITVEIDLEGDSTVTKNVEQINFTNGSTIDATDILNQSDKDLSKVVIDNLDRSGSSLSGEITITAEHPDITETYEQSFEITSPNYIDATGGTTVEEVTIGDKSYRIHAFESTQSDTFEVNQAPSNRTIDFLVVGGGGGGGSDGGGGGGAGGVLYEQDYTVNEGKYNTYVGSGGAGDGVPDDGVNADNGEDSIFGQLTAIGGGGGASWNSGGGNDGSNGGSGGGAAGSDQSHIGGSAIQPSSTDGGSGNSGGDANDSGGGGGGGGAKNSGSNSPNSSDAGNGGDGNYYGDIFTNKYGENGYFGGGGGGGDQTSDATGGSGGLGGGADSNGASTAPSGDPNTGGGGAGSSGSGSYDGGDGGSGIILVRYRIA